MNRKRWPAVELLLLIVLTANVCALEHLDDSCDVCRAIQNAPAEHVSPLLAAQAPLAVISPLIPAQAGSGYAATVSQERPSRAPPA
jgi:hypothetical protein